MSSPTPTRHRLRMRVVLWFAFVILAVGGAGSYGFRKLTDAIRREAVNEMKARLSDVSDVLDASNTIYTERLDVGIRLLKNLLEQAGAPALVRRGGEETLCYGLKSAVGDFGAVDKVSEITGSKATVFQKKGGNFVRIATNVPQKDGKRAIGIPLDPSGKAARALRDGRSFRGLVDVLGTPALAAYEPVFDAGGSLIGALYVGFELRTLPILREAVEKQATTDHGFLALFDAGNELVFKTRGTRDTTAKALDSLGENGDFHHGEWVVTDRSFPAWGYHMIGAVFLPDVRMKSWGILWQVYGIFATVLIAVLIVSFFLAARLSDSLEAEEEALRSIAQAQKRLSDELQEAARYVLSILPAPMKSPLGISWSYAPSTEIGGDSFGYHLLDKHHVALYLLDVCGHGVGAALLSVAAINVIRSGTLPHTDFHDPSRVLTGLNLAFPMERNNEMYFTVWYGVYDLSSRTLKYSSAGHPPALLLQPCPGGEEELLRLDCSGMLVGAMPRSSYATRTVSVPPGGRLFVYSDGAFEVRKHDGTDLDFDREFVPALLAKGRSPRVTEEMLAWARSLHGGGAALADDFSMMAVDFPVPENPPAP